MAAEHHDTNQLMGLLRSRGLRITPARLKLFRVLLERAVPCTISELGEELEAQEIAPATVYRMLELFVAIGVVRTVLLPHGRVGYELISPFRPHHHHLSCEQCGAVIDLADCDLASLQAQIEARTGFAVRAHALDFYGLCAKCQANRHSSERS